MTYLIATDPKELEDRFDLGFKVIDQCWVSRFGLTRFESFREVFICPGYNPIT